VVTWLRWCVLGVCLAVVPAWTWAATIKVEVDRNPVQVDESFQVVFTVDGSADGDPDFTPLEKDFEILGRSQSTSMQIINLNISRHTIWTLSLMPKTTGSLVIPAISFGSDKSPVTWVTVVSAPLAQPGKANGDLFLEVAAKPDETYVQAQVFYTVRLFRAVNVLNASLTEPKTSGADAVVTKLGDDKSYETRRGGRRYVVTERRYAIFPQESGQMVIQPVVFEGRYVDGFNSLRSKRLRSDALALDIKPVPAAASKSWLPANKVTLSEQWPDDPPKFTVGEPVTRTLVLSADGLTAAQLPKLAGDDVAGFKTYAEQPKLEDKPTHGGMVGTRRESAAFVATKPGTYTLPAISVHWWNINSNQAETATIPARTIRVLPAAGEGAASPAAPAPATADHTASATPAAAAAATPSSGQGAGAWPWIAGITTIGWLVTLLVWWRSHRPEGPQQPAAQPPAPSASLKQLERAVRAGDAPAAKAALLTWAKQQWPDNPPTNLNEIGRRLGGEAESLIQTLNQALYGQTGDQSWNQPRLYEIIRRTKADKSNKKRQPETALPPLFP
jgi:hypothetical protein